MSYSKLETCRHCGNISKMLIVGSINEVEESSYDQDEGYIGGHGGTMYSILRCPACEKINVVYYYWHDQMESEEQFDYKFLYPLNPEAPLGLPAKILTAYKSAERVRTIDANAYAILTRRLLELVCLDRDAKGKNLASMLVDLADRNEIPTKLVKIATGLKDFGNVGAHAGSGELTADEIPIVSALCNAILEYVYSAPYLATIAEEKLRIFEKKTY